MRFAHPQVLWLALLLLPALAFFLAWAWRRKLALISQFVQSRLLAHLTVGVSYARQKLRLFLLLFATAFALLAAARPQWGVDWQEATTQGLDIIVAIDTSKSMLAEDISPNRLMRAKLAVYDLLRVAKSDRFGLIAFAGTAFLQCPLTLDEQVFRQSVESLDVNIIPQGGTALSEAINTARTAFEKSENHKVLVLLTDGEDHDSDAVAAAGRAAKEGMKIFTIGVGTQDGELLRVRDERGNQVFLKDPAGNAIKSRLNEGLLQQIATEGNGFYLPLIGTTAMDSLYKRGLASLPRSESTTKLVKSYRDRFHWPLSIAIALLLLEAFLPHKKRGRDASVGGSAKLKQATLLAFISLIPLLSSASPAAAYKKYEAGNYQDALKEYQEALREKTNDFRLQYNAGNAAYQAQKFEDARKYFEASTVAPDLKLQQQAYYNLGNTLYQIGEPASDPKEKEQAWEQAVKNYENALRLDAKDEDAKHNLAFVKQKIEELKQQQQQQQQQDPSKQDKNEQNKDQQDQQQQASSQNDQNKQNQAKQDQQKSDQAQKDSQQEKQEQQQDQQGQAQNRKPEESKDQQQSGQSGQPGEEQAQEQEGEAAAADGKMTEQQAQQFLDAIKREEKPLIFTPPPKERKNADQPLKDW